MSVQPSSDVITAAQLAFVHWKIPASVSLAQYGLESGWGQHMPAASNNPFGIKAKPGEPCSSTLTREVIHGQDVMIHAGFRMFASIGDAFDYHAELLATAGAYAHARSLLPDVDAFCNALTGVYATDPKYGALLIQIINGSGLRRFDVQP
jgi:flagellum-specific peptidoglycan hydrolase FlgJ